MGSGTHFESGYCFPGYHYAGSSFEYYCWFSVWLAYLEKHLKQCFQDQQLDSNMIATSNVGYLLRHQPVGALSFLINLSS